jgi:hypothetical protein
MMPKRLKTAFISFYEIYTRQLNKVHPCQGRGSAASLAGKRWREMTEEEKAPYFKLQEDDRLRFGK